MKFLEKQSPSRIIAAGFLAVILLGSWILMLPCSVRPGVDLAYIDALFTSTSAVCVTGLIAVDVGDTFTPFGQAVVAGLIQIGGLGVTSVGVGMILALGRKVNLKERLLVKEAMNVDTGKGMVNLVKNVLKVTLCFEVAGAILSFICFSKRYDPLKALGVSVFHSIAAFNNSGFDNMGNFQNLIPYKDDVLLNMTTCGLIIFGGLGFLVIVDILKKRSFRKLAFHSKAVIVTTIVLLTSGTLLIQLTEDITWMGALFTSVSARTAGFSTFSLGDFTNAGLLAVAVLMFMGASPGSTGGGIKTSTFFVLVQSIRSLVTKKNFEAFRRSIPADRISKAYVITLLSILVVCTATFLLCILEPGLNFIQILFEVVSAFGTVGLSTGITPDLIPLSKFVIILVMFIGRLGAFTLFSMWIDRPAPAARYVEESITIG